MPRNPKRARRAAARALGTALFALTSTLAPALALTAAAGTLGVGLVDDFETETSEGWQTGLAAAPVSTTGGPAGSGDAYLQPAANGGIGSGGRLAVFNTLQWAGDYATAGIEAISLDALHVSGSDVSLRIALSGPSGDVASSTPIVVSAPGAWESLELSLDPADLTTISGAAPAVVLGNVTHLRILHSASLPTAGTGGFPRGEVVLATIGIDNVTAVPETSSFSQAAAVLGALGALARRRLRAAACGPQPCAAETSSR